MEPEGFDWQRYAGTELRYVGETQPLSDHVLSILPKFEEMTGIKVNTEILPWAQMVQKIRVELMASNEDMDVYQLPAGAERGTSGSKPAGSTISVRGWTTRP